MDTLTPEDEDFPGRLLHQAALWDNAELLEDLLRGDQIVHVNSQDAWGRTALHAAATTKNSRCLSVLLQAGANPNIPCGPKGDNRTPLHASAEHGHIGNVQLLLAHRADLVARDVGGLTPLDIAEKCEHAECMLVLKQSADARERARYESHAALRETCLLGDTTKTRELLKELGEEAELVVNMAPNGSTTLLFISCEAGNKEIVQMLLAHNADGRIHPVTKYSPLYIACYNGRKDIAELLLKRFPSLITQSTVEKWLPIHACCINGHLHVMELLLKFPYPEHLLHTFRDARGEWQYRMVCDINSRDVTGQSVLYVACLLGNYKMTELLIKFRIKATRVTPEEEAVEAEGKAEEVLSPTRRRISDGIQSIMARLNLTRSESKDAGVKKECLLAPLQLNMYCNNNAETPLHAAVRGRFSDIATLLILSGADTNCVCTMPEGEEAGGTSTALVAACRNRDVGLVDLLLRHKARDDDCRALKVAVTNGDELLITKLLTTKAHADPDYKLNKAAMSDAGIVASFSQTATTNLTYSALFPNTSTMINWHDQRCNLSHVRVQWLIDAALSVNPKLKLNPRSQEVALFAITRIDLSRNALSWLPAVLFQLPSLRCLNLAQNKIEKLPEEGGKFNAPVLEELYLQDNRLEQIGECVFRLPSLVTLDVSNNKLATLPHAMWQASKLKELNAAFNLLSDLPAEVNAVRSVGHTEATAVKRGRSESVTDDQLVDAQTLHENSNRDKTLQQLDVTRHSIWSRQVEVTEQILHTDDEVQDSCSQLSALNLAHNQFTSIPVCLSCLAVKLTRLNLSYNCLGSMSHITAYPGTLKQLDLSHNHITCWPSLPQMEPLDAALTCYSITDGANNKTANTGLRGRSLRSAILDCVCAHRRHLRLDNLRTLIVADNKLARIQLTTDDDGGGSSVSEEDDADWDMVGAPGKSRLMFPNLSMLDISNNKLREIPHNIHELSNLSVLNISGNTDITELPPQMGLLSRLWNLNSRGCVLQEPLKSMIDSKKYKTMDVIGYLKSVLEDARPYARMKLMIVGVQSIGKTSLLEQLRQEGQRKRQTEHWAKRMGNKNINTKTSRGSNMSTVGVDIGDWIYEKKLRGQSQHGPVVFRTWDFGGQREYYATHQYFLSKRSLYLVVWKISDGLRGVNEILGWLVNIQARAPNSPVLIVGTHYDMVRDLYPASVSEDLQQVIRDKFINIVDAEKCGLPRVLDTIEVSCKTRHNIKLLCNLIYDTVFSLKPPGSKELLLEQRVPASYLALEDVIGHLVHERRQNGVDPVLNAEQYRGVVTAEMQYRYQRTFRDSAELSQATMFLHENGVLLHYDDAILKDLYFLDPQWLCDMLAHVVTIREINPFARNGVMKLDDLKHVFKNSTLGQVDTRGYIVNLLNKFEVALTWDSRTLLIPSLLCSEEQLRAPHAQPVRVKIPVRSRGWAIRQKKAVLKMVSSTLVGNSQFYTPSDKPQRPTSIAGISSPCYEEPPVEATDHCEVTHRNDPEVAIRRLLLMSYFPAGFWSRLITRVMGDESIVDIVRGFFITPKEMVCDPRLTQLLDAQAEWILWQTGMELRYADTTLFRMKEVLPGLRNTPTDYRQLKFRLKQEGQWMDTDLANSSILEIYFPVDTVVVKRPIRDELGGGEPIGWQAVVLDPSPECTAKLLALAVDHIDILLEDWYPTLGTRFVHTSEGRFLVTRLVPCPRCITASQPVAEDAWTTSHLNQEDLDYAPRRVRKSQESCASDPDSGVDPDSRGSSRVASMEGHPSYAERPERRGELMYSWTIEECILAACTGRTVVCPTHGDIALAQIAPDTMFLDLGERHLVRADNITRGPLLGRGAFGFVFRGACKVRGSGATVGVAMKMLQPVQPGADARQSALIAFKAAEGKWARDPLQYACKAYCTARQELNILLSLRHCNIVPLVGVCVRPLALVLDLAPQGALDAALRNYRRSGAHLHNATLQALILQVAKAVEYLHQQHIIYRDLKSENVLVWQIPAPFQQAQGQDTLVKLADYGISRLALPAGTKGFGGTEGFMAPEIMRFNGEEEYTEKVDCFSFAMFLYELLTLHQPFEGHEAVKECILEGGRPSLAFRETLYPSHMLDLMVLCWSQSPRDRPTASQIVSVASAPEFTHLLDTVSLNHSADVLASSITQDQAGGDSATVWLACDGLRCDLLATNENGVTSHYTRRLAQRTTAATCVGNTVWLGDCMGQLHAYDSSGALLWSYALDPEAPGSHSVTCLLSLPALSRVAVGLANGRLFLVCSDTTPTNPTRGEGSFVMTELGGDSLHALAAVFTENTCELWCGESHGNVSIFTITDQVVSSHDVISHQEQSLSDVNVMHLLASQQDTCVYSYVYPGCVVYQWDSATRTISNRLDCSKLVPCSESLKSISIEEHLSPGKCQVTSMAVHQSELYVGTTWGCLVVAERSSMRPITVFRPYEEEVRAIVPLSFRSRSLILTVGRGYRSLIHRYLDSVASTPTPVSLMAGDWRPHNVFALVWQAGDWAAA